MSERNTNGSPGPKKRRRRKRRGRGRKRKQEQEHEQAADAQAPAEAGKDEAANVDVDADEQQPAPDAVPLPAETKPAEVPVEGQPSANAPEADKQESDEKAEEEIAPSEPPTDEGTEPEATTPSGRQPTIFQAAVRWGMLRQTETLVTRLRELCRGEYVIVDTARGAEVAEVLGTEVPVSPETLKDSLGEISRRATQDEVKLSREGWIIDKMDPLFREARELIGRHKLPMRLTGIEKLLSGDRTIFYFSADGRVDFRSLVRDLARKVRGRVEMRQIGARDEAKLLGDRSDCGQPLCCRTWLGTLEPIPMKFAKIQTATLDPTKISGVCGRLKCCLRYEYDVYIELRNNLPGRGDTVTTQSGFSGRVVDYQILPQRVVLQDEDRRREVFSLAEVSQVERQQREGKRRRKRRDGKGKSDRGGSGSNEQGKSSRRK
jgi:cell fate regulator YaaT (PSP1 superfamily)